MNNSHDTKATVAWSATETDAYSEPPFPDDAFCIRLAVLNGDHHIYRLKRETLVQLSNHISCLLDKSSTAKANEASLATLTAYSEIQTKAA